jgi:hypothetical protein
LSPGAHALQYGLWLLSWLIGKAALEPETLRQAMSCVFERAPSLLVIAHP